MGKGKKTRNSMFSFGLSSSDEDSSAPPHASATAWKASNGVLQACIWARQRLSTPFHTSACLTTTPLAEQHPPAQHMSCMGSDNTHKRSCCTGNTAEALQLHATCAVLDNGAGAACDPHVIRLEGAATPANEQSGAWREEGGCAPLAWASCDIRWHLRPVKGLNCKLLWEPDEKDGRQHTVREHGTRGHSHCTCALFTLTVAPDLAPTPAALVPGLMSNALNLRTLHTDRGTRQLRHLPP